ncbi:hypothetical protein JHK85_004756 [Glycine max]|nr:hypothetical protein JHK85_004756 [Glycine max]
MILLYSTVTNQNVNQKLIDLFQVGCLLFSLAVLFTELYASETRKLVERLINYVIYKIPLGVILAILDLALIALSKSAPALIAGNSFVLKPPTQIVAEEDSALLGSFITLLEGFLQADANRVSLFCKPYQFRDCSGCFSLWESVYANNIGVHGLDCEGGGGEEGGSGGDTVGNGSRSGEWRHLKKNLITTMVMQVQWRVEAPEEEFGHNDGDAGGFDERGEKRVE